MNGYKGMEWNGVEWSGMNAKKGMDRKEQIERNMQKGIGTYVERHRQKGLGKMEQVVMNKYVNRKE